MNRYDEYSDTEKEIFKLAIFNQLVGDFNQARKEYFLIKAVNKIWYN